MKVDPNNNSAVDEEPVENPTVVIWSFAKHLNLSLEEINEMSTQTLVDIFIEYIKQHAYSEDDADAPAKQATQADIDAFFC